MFGVRLPGPVRSPTRVALRIHGTATQRRPRARGDGSPAHRHRADVDGSASGVLVGDAYGPTFPAIFYGVLKQVREDADALVGIERHAYGGGRRNVEAYGAGASVRIDRVPRLCDGFIQKAVRIRRSDREVEHRKFEHPVDKPCESKRFGSCAAQKAALRPAPRFGVDDGVEIDTNRGDRRAQLVSDDGEKFVALAFEDTSFQGQGNVFLEMRPSPGRHDRPPTLDRSACGRRHLRGDTRQSRPAVTRAGHAPRPRRGIHKRRKNIAPGIIPTQSS